MLNKMGARKNKKNVFICQIAEGFLKVIKCSSKIGIDREFTGLESEPLTFSIEDKRLAEKLKSVFLKLGYNNNPLILSLPRSQITCRYLKIPSLVPQEIERISCLQASRYLPYTAEELITSYQLIQADKEGYSHIVLVIAHRDVVNSYINLFKELNPAKINIIPSFAGLVNLCGYVLSEERGLVMLIDIDYQQVEFAMILRQKLAFSRSFNLSNNVDWEITLINEINKTLDAYKKEVAKESPSKIVLLGAAKVTSRCQELIKNHGIAPTEVFSYGTKIKFAKGISDKLINLDNSFASLIGLGLREIAASLSLLPCDLKEKERKGLYIKEYLRLALFVGGIILIWIIAIAKNLDNKTRYLDKLKIEVSKVSQEASPLEEAERRLKVLNGKKTRSSSGIDLLHGLYQVMPDQISLTNFSYEQGNKVSLRGQAIQLNSVFVFVSRLEGSQVFNKFNIKIRYATQKKTQAGEIVSFELVCTRK